MCYKHRILRGALAASLCAAALAALTSPAAAFPPAGGQVVTYHGGPVITHVKVQALYWGAGWKKNPTQVAQSGQLESFLRFVVGSSYMDQLTGAGYTDGQGAPIGRGSFTPGRLDLATLPAAVTDDRIQNELSAKIQDGTLADPDTQRLYVVFVDKDVVINTSFGSSATNFAGYHFAFNGRTRAGKPSPVYYAAIPYPGGRNLPAEPGLPILPNLTEVVSHELAEAVTDPFLNAWFEDAKPGQDAQEIGDITRFIPNHTCFLGGFLVQKVSDRSGQPLVPAGSTPGPVTKVNNRVRLK
jgi:hypothetical protein